jgi:hypothetical protein
MIRIDQVGDPLVHGCPPSHLTPKKKKPNFLTKEWASVADFHQVGNPATRSTRAGGFASHPLGRFAFFRAYAFCPGHSIGPAKEKL